MPSFHRCFDSDGSEKQRYLDSLELGSQPYKEPSTIRFSCLFVTHMLSPMFCQKSLRILWYCRGCAQR